jgi:hypothetical protein
LKSTYTNIALHKHIIMQNESYVWLSLDPVRCEINFYPRDIAYKIEKFYELHTDFPCMTSAPLGSNFFDATVQFHSIPKLPYYQTIPKCSGGAWYRSVKRIVLTPGSTHVEIFGKIRIANEWHITDNYNDSEKTLYEEIPPDVINDVPNDEVPNKKVPNEYLCSITQDIMQNPVKTTDNHTYDRVSIERWFKTRNTSPLTGLPLDDISLTPHTVLHHEIKEYIRLKILQIESLGYIPGDLTVDSNLYLSGRVDVDISGTLNASNILLTEKIKVTGDASFNVGVDILQNLFVNGDASFNGDIY